MFTYNKILITIKKLAHKNITQENLISRLDESINIHWQVEQVFKYFLKCKSASDGNVMYNFKSFIFKSISISVLFGYVSDFESFSLDIDCSFKVVFVVVVIHVCKAILC